MNAQAEIIWGGWCFSCNGMIVACWDDDLSQAQVAELWVCPHCGSPVSGVQPANEFKRPPKPPRSA
jgi:hypothetical protein